MNYIKDGPLATISSRLSRYVEDLLLSELEVDVADCLHKRFFVMHHGSSMFLKLMDM